MAGTQTRDLAAAERDWFVWDELESEPHTSKEKQEGQSEVGHAVFSLPSSLAFSCFSFQFFAVRSL
eukprot:m.231962 g.231962  ORF g.231962 m.231962 type:complete len:66 (+) comp18544_c0_seq1:103-300(+)